MTGHHPKYIGFQYFFSPKSNWYELRACRNIQGFALIYEQSCSTTIYVNLAIIVTHFCIFLRIIRLNKKSKLVWIRKGTLEPNYYESRNKIFNELIQHNEHFSTFFQNRKHCRGGFRRGLGFFSLGIQPAHHPNGHLMVVLISAIGLSFEKPPHPTPHEKPKSTLVW